MAELSGDKLFNLEDSSWKTKQRLGRNSVVIELKKKKSRLNIYYHQLKLLRSGKALMNRDLILDAQNYSESILLLVQGEGNLTLESEGSWF